MTKLALSTTLTFMAAAFGLSLLGGVAISTSAAACVIGKPCPPPKNTRPWASLSGLKFQQATITPTPPRPTVPVVRGTLVAAKRR